jgi:hypothetical protein
VLVLAVTVVEQTWVESNPLLPVVEVLGRPRHKLWTARDSMFDLVLARSDRAQASFV